MGDFLESIKPTWLKKVQKALEPPGSKEKEQEKKQEKKQEKEKAKTLKEMEQKQGEGFGGADIGLGYEKIVPNTQSIMQRLMEKRKQAMPVEKPKHYKKGNPKKINVGF